MAPAFSAAVIVFPGSNCDRDVAVALQRASGTAPHMVWHGEADLPEVDLIVVPGGFSYGDYLRSGAMAAHSPIMRAVVARAEAGTPTLGICNGFQILCEAGLLPGALTRNRDLAFLAKTVPVTVDATNSAFTARYEAGATVRFPIAHHDGCYYADDDTLARVEDEGQVAFRYVDNPNGSRNAIAGLFNARRTVLGLMPHPERAVDPELGGTDGAPLFRSVVEALS